MHGDTTAQDLSAGRGSIGGVGAEGIVIRWQVLFQTVFVVTGRGSQDVSVWDIVRTDTVPVWLSGGGGGRGQSEAATVPIHGYAGCDLLPVRTLGGRGVAVQCLLVLVRRVKVAAGTAEGLFLKENVILVIILRIIKLQDLMNI